MQVIAAASGLAVLAIVIGYLPSLYQAFSRREATVSQLDARAGSPPTAGRLVIRSTQHGGWPALNRVPSGWETWVAELMETHLAYPVLAYFRSQHVNQNWLSAMCTVLDACALTIAAAPHETIDSARFTYAIARHAVVDLSYSFHVPPADPTRGSPAPRQAARAARPAARGRHRARRRRRAGAGAARATCARSTSRTSTRLPRRLELRLPQWLAPESPTDNWRTTEWH